jgi:hypothetical protein
MKSHTSVKSNVVFGRNACRFWSKNVQKVILRYLLVSTAKLTCNTVTGSNLISLFWEGEGWIWTESTTTEATIGLLYQARMMMSVKH